MPTGTCGGLVVTELPAPMAAFKFSWEQPQVGCNGARRRGCVGCRSYTRTADVTAGATCHPCLHCEHHPPCNLHHVVSCMTMESFPLQPMPQGKPALQLTARCGKCKACLRPTLRKPCLSPVTLSEEEAVAAAAENAK